jgi:sterol desaturase/sphingolipid hydroxylase (fatty acid hydroxylase superfamily)
METSSWYALGIPLFVALLVGERLLLRRGVRDASDTITNLGCGLGQVVFGVFSGPLVLFLYRGFHARFAVTALPPWLEWPLAFVGVDACYYWMHRGNHRVRLFWLTHAVHHQSERFDVSVALRQTWLSDFVALFYYWPLPLLGVREVPFFVAVAVLSVYQVLLHTELVGRSRSAFGWVFNTPSHHRVHHGRVSQGGGRNFGATLIVWDRIFGTFEAESGNVTYGVTPPFTSADPIWAQVEPFARSLGLGRVRLRHEPSHGAIALAAGALVGAGLLAAGLLPATLGQPLAVRAPIALAVFAALALIGALLDGRLTRARGSSPS